MKNDNIHIFPRFDQRALLKNKNTRLGMETVRTAKSRPRKNQSERKDLPETGFAI